MRTFVSTLAVVALAASATSQPKLKVIVDQDARGPCTTDIQAILMFVQSPDVEVLGITVVSGDLWLEAGSAAHVAGRSRSPGAPTFRCIEVRSFHSFTPEKKRRAGSRCTANSRIKARGRATRDRTKRFRFEKGAEH